MVGGLEVEGNGATGTGVVTVKVEDLVRGLSHGLMTGVVVGGLEVAHKMPFFFNIPIHTQMTHRAP